MDALDSWAEYIHDTPRARHIAEWEIDPFVYSLRDLKSFGKLRTPEEIRKVAGG